MEKLREDATQFGIVLTDHMLQMFSLYMDLLLDWNTKINLTAITSKEDIQIKHFLDSLLLLDAVEIPTGASLLDIGSGAGFPGVPLKIVRPDISLTLLDSLKKRIAFLEKLSQHLGQDIVCVHSRAEELGNLIAYREAFDMVTARAVAALPILLEYCLPFVRVGGVFAAMKGPNVKQEITGAAHALDTLGAKLVMQKHFELPSGDSRVIFIFKKIAQTSAKYPRKSGKIAKYPL